MHKISRGLKSKFLAVLVFFTRQRMYSVVIPALFFTIIALIVFTANYYTTSQLTHKNLTRSISPQARTSKALHTQVSQVHHQKVSQQRNKNHWAFYKKGFGYAGKIELVVILDETGKFLNFHVVKKKREEGFRRTLNSELFEQKLRGHALDKELAIELLDSITGATRTYTTVLQLIQSAYTDFQKQSNASQPEAAPTPPTPSPQVASAPTAAPAPPPLSPKPTHTSPSPQAKKEEPKPPHKAPAKPTPTPTKKPKPKKAAPKEEKEVKKKQEDVEIFLEADNNTYKAKRHKHKTEEDYLNQLFNQ